MPPEDEIFSRHPLKEFKGLGVVQGSKRGRSLCRLHHKPFARVSRAPTRVAPAAAPTSPAMAAARGPLVARKRAPVANAAQHQLEFSVPIAGKDIGLHMIKDHAEEEQELFGSPRVASDWKIYMRTRAWLSAC